MSIPWHTVPAALLLAACLPRDDLSSYASNSVGQGGAGEASASPDASSGGLQGQGANPGETTDPNLPLGGGGSEQADASTALADAGVPELDASPADSGTIDAGLLANACAATQGNLQTGTNVCLFFAAAARVSWQAASLACQSRSSALVSIKDVARNDFLTNLIGSTDIWTGGNDPSTIPGANTFVWRDNTPVSLVLDTWAFGEPDAVADQFCVAKTGEAAAPPNPASPWRDRPCSELKAYVCEQSL